VTDLVQLADRHGLVGFVVTWLLVALLAVVLVHLIIGVLGAGLELRTKWFRRPR